QRGLHRIIDRYATVQKVLNRIIEILHVSKSRHCIAFSAPFQHFVWRLCPYLLRLWQSQQHKVTTKRLPSKLSVSGVPVPLGVPLNKSTIGGLRGRHAVYLQQICLTLQNLSVTHVRKDGHNRKVIHFHHGRKVADTYHRIGSTIAVHMHVSCVPVSWLGALPVCCRCRRRLSARANNTDKNQRKNDLHRTNPLRRAHYPFIPAKCRRTSYDEMLSKPFTKISAIAIVVVPNSDFLIY